MRIRKRGTAIVASASASASAGAGAIDLALVTAFTLIGRASHSSDTPFVVTLWPFAVGVIIGWLVSRAWRSPLKLTTGLVIWLSTVVIGVTIRALSGQGVQLSFIIVTALVLGVFLIGWRAVATVIGWRALTKVRRALTKVKR